MRYTFFTKSVYFLNIMKSKKYIHIYPYIYILYAYPHVSYVTDQHTHTYYIYIYIYIYIHTHTFLCIYTLIRQYTIIHILLQIKTSVQPTKSSPDDDSEVRHGFSTNTSLTLPQSVPVVSKNTTRHC